MSLVGTYTNNELGATLSITSANVSDGTGGGTFSMGGIDYPIALHFHFDNNVGPNAVLQIWTSNTYGWDYVGAAGSSDSAEINLAGGASSVSGTTPFSGVFSK